MYFERIEPAKHLHRYIDCYWIIKDNDPQPHSQKIIPDGFAELIFHFGDPYRIKLDDKWKMQSNSLLAGQITKYFYLQNTGVSDILGIKLKPTTVTHLFGIDAAKLTDGVPNLTSFGNRPKDLATIIHSANEQERVQRAEEFFTSITSGFEPANNVVDRALELIHARNGMISVSEIISIINLSERQFERLFKKYVGLSPKFYARIIRFNYIFQLKENKKEFWTDLALDAAFYDQSHFIRNFKAFTGESPSDYFFEENNMANFFLKMKRKPGVKKN